jgi:hypothetical protein|tara:strand:- start:129 stop:245 length:117 start_codon:yes stop_codon:yes gene_type:complete
MRASSGNWLKEQWQARRWKYHEGIQRQLAQRAVASQAQ